MSRGNSRTKASSWYGYCRLSRTMITGYKKKKLGHPSEKLSGDVPRAKWRTVIIAEIIWPICIAIIFVVAYMFVKSFPQDGLQPPSPLIRIAVIAVGPVVWNAAVLLALFFVSLLMGPMMSSVPKFGSVVAATAHFLALVGIVAFFKFFVRDPSLRRTMPVMNFPRTMGGLLLRFALSFISHQITETYITIYRFDLHAKVGVSQS